MAKKIRPVLMVSALTGSEKQVRWAESIRREKMAAPVNGWPVIQANRQINAWPGTAATPVPRGGLTTATNGPSGQPN